MEELEPRTLLLAGSLAIGLGFGAVGRLSGFCLRSAVIEILDRKIGRQTVSWAIALFIAVTATQWLHASETIDLTQSIYLAENLNFVSIIIGGLLFGVGMVLTRGCGGRHLVLAASGNLRSWLVLSVLGVTAYATSRGILALARIPLEDLGTVSFDNAANQSVAHLLSGGEQDTALYVAVVIAAVVCGIGIFAAIRSMGHRWTSKEATISVASGAVIGLLIPLGWYVTGVLGNDEFDPIRLESLSFTMPLGNGLQYVMTYTGAQADFGITVVGGVLVGAFIAALASGTLRAEGFDTAGHMMRYITGAAFMGFGGVLALGCTIGAGLSGVSTLSLGSLLALASIVGGAAIGHKVKVRIFGGRQPQVAPAE